VRTFVRNRRPRPSDPWLYRLGLNPGTFIDGRANSLSVPGWWSPVRENVQNFARDHLHRLGYRLVVRRCP